MFQFLRMKIIKVYFPNVFYNNVNNFNYDINLIFNFLNIVVVLVYMSLVFSNATKYILHILHFIFLNFFFDH